MVGEPLSKLRVRNTIQTLEARSKHRLLLEPRLPILGHAARRISTAPGTLRPMFHALGNIALRGQSASEMADCHETLDVVQRALRRARVMRSQLNFLGWRWVVCSR